MAHNISAADGDDYDVLIADDLNHSETEQCPQYDAKILASQLLPPLFATVFLLGLLDNFLVMLILVKYKRLRHVENIYFLNLAMSNLCFLFTLPFWAHSASHGELLGDSMCKILAALSSMGLQGEALFNVLLTGKNYLVFFHVRNFSAAGKMACGIITSVLAWITAILVTLPEFLPYKSQMGLQRQEHKCFFSRPHFLPGDETFWKYFLTLKVNIVGLLVPSLVFIFCYVRMRITLRSRDKKYDLFKLVFAIMVVFLLMWGPYGMALLLSTFKEHFSLQDCKSSYNLDRSVQITRIIAATHCCVNPLLYGLLDKAFRKYLCHLFHLCDNTPPRPTENSAQDTSWGEHDHSTEV
ncbi:C-C chemokine receptor-like 2 isoform X2 [Rhinolophus ferrumequinum]|nr:C-C chemokine receptor-like 2 isoform X2 [Rhinolophus ferrumequinum]